MTVGDRYDVAKIKMSVEEVASGCPPATITIPDIDEITWLRCELAPDGHHITVDFGHTSPYPGQQVRYEFTPGVYCYSAGTVRFNKQLRRMRVHLQTEVRRTAEEAG